MKLKPLRALIILGIIMLTSCMSTAESCSFNTNAVLNDGTDVQIRVHVDYLQYSLQSDSLMHNQVVDGLKNRLTLGLVVMFIFIICYSAMDSAVEKKRAEVLGGLQSLSE